MGEPIIPTLLVSLALSKILIWDGSLITDIVEINRKCVKHYLKEPISCSRSSCRLLCMDDSMGNTEYSLIQFFILRELLVVS